MISVSGQLLSHVDKQVQVDRLIALWALSEAALGGALHAFRIPLTGLLVNGTAVILMVFIASFSPKRGAILKATFVVIIVKGIVSPHTPLAAYIAVGFQGLMGELLLRSKRYLLLSSLLLGIITLLQSSFQKIIILTFVYGNVLWESIDLFGNFVTKQLAFLPVISEDFSFSHWMIGIYILIHVCMGVLVGILAARLPGWVEKEIGNVISHPAIDITENSNGMILKKRKKKWYQKLTTIAIFLLAIGVISLSYVFPEISESQAVKALIMIIRALSIMAIWYFLLGPWILKLYQKYMSKKQNVYTIDVQNTLDVLPVLYRIIYQTWQNSRSYNGLKRVKVFVVSVFVNILTIELS